MSSDSMSMVTGVMQPSGLTMSPPTVDGMQLLSEEEKFQERRRDILVLVMRFLVDYGYSSAYQTLCAEASTSLDQVDAADNIDLMMIVQEFVDYYHSRFGRYPKLVRHNYMPPASFQMPMQQIHAMQLQAAVAAAQTAAQAKVQQQRQQQLQQQQQQQQQAQQAQQHSASVSKIPQVTSSQPMSLTQPMMLSQPSIAASMGMPVCGLTGISQALAKQPLGVTSLSAATSTAAPAINMQQTSSSPTKKQQEQQQQQQFVQITPLKQLPQTVAAAQQQPAERVIPATAQVERVQIAYLDAAQGSTCKLGTTQPVDQVGFIAVLSAAPPTDLPSRYFSYRQPSKKSKRGSERFNASDLQEEVMYALVGCSDVGWSSRKITNETRDFLLKHYGIEKGTITTFFKNRSQRKPYSVGADGLGRRNSAASSRNGSRTGSTAGAACKPAASAASKLGPAAAASNMLPTAAAAATASLLASTAAKAATLQGSGLSALTTAPVATPLRINGIATPSVMATSPALSPAGLAPFGRPVLSAAMSDRDALADASYAGLDGLGAFRGFDGLCRQSSLPGFSTSMCLPCGLDADNYLGSDLDMAASAMGLVAGDVCCSPSGFSS